MSQLHQPTTATLKKTQRLRLALTLGDPAGVGPEVILKALADVETWQTQPLPCDVTIIGSRSQLVETYNQLNQKQSTTLAAPDNLSVLDVDPDSAHQIVTGVGNAASGAASFAYMETAIAHTLAGKFHGIVTAPIAKSAWKAAGHDYPGQTELLAQRAGVKRFGMLFVARSPYTGWTLRTLLATTHIPLRQVADTLTPQLLATKLDLLVACLQQDFGLERPRIVIAGLNPHSGEQGQLGHEEQDWLIPWLEQERQNRPNLQLDGPIPPDTMWVKPSRSWYGELGRWEDASVGATRRVAPTPSTAGDAYLALYHDQGLIPVKQLAFDRAVNTSIGLPFIRTSPDHGTAFDIAGIGIADATSMKAALQLAAELAYRKVAANIMPCQWR